MYSDPHEVLESWLQAINTGDLEGVLALYAPASVLLPTFSGHRLESHEQRREYFRQLAAKQGLRVELHGGSLRSDDHGHGLHTLSGIYRWHLESDGEDLTFEARFTFTVDLVRPAPIVHHHSSQIPRAL